ncbi:HPP family protein [bacterium]|nr:HPP family protein [bacterium]
MHIIDPKLTARTLRNYLFQAAIATGYIFLVFMVLDHIVELVIVAGLGSSAFIVFAMPSKVSAGPRFVVGGHIVCFIVGTLTRLSIHDLFVNFVALSPKIEMIVSCSLAVGLSLFMMVITDTEHPPAAGTAVGTAFADFSFAVMVSVLLGAIMLSVGKFLLRRWLKDLV